MDVAILYNRPVLAPASPGAAAEAGVLESVEAVSAALQRCGHTPRTVAADDIRQLAQQLSNLKADVVFNLFEGFGGVGHGEAEVAGLIELMGFRMTGSPSAALQLVRDKARTKWLLQGAGLPTSDFLLIGSHETDPLDRAKQLLTRGPVIVKPAHEDASLGIGPQSIVSDETELAPQIERVRAQYGAVLVEHFIVGREFNVAILALPEPQVLPLAEIEFSGSGKHGWQIVSYDAKWKTGSDADRETTPRCPANVDDETSERISYVALEAFQLTGCRQYARVDLRMDKTGRIFILEVNGNPDIGPTAGFSRALVVAEIPYEQFIDRLVRGA